MAVPSGSFESVQETQSTSDLVGSAQQQEALTPTYSQRRAKASTQAASAYLHQLASRKAKKVSTRKDRDVAFWLEAGFSTEDVSPAVDFVSPADLFFSKEQGYYDKNLRDDEKRLEFLRRKVIERLADAPDREVITHDLTTKEDSVLKDIVAQATREERELSLWDLRDRIHSSLSRKKAFWQSKRQRRWPDPYLDLARTATVPAGFNLDLLPRYAALDVIGHNARHMTEDEVSEPPIPIGEGGDFPWTARILVWDEQTGLVLLLDSPDVHRRSRRKMAKGIDLPGGPVEFNETLLSAGLRHLSESTTYCLDRPECALVYPAAETYTSPEGKSSQVGLIVVRYSDCRVQDAGELTKYTRSDSDLLWLSLAEIQSLDPQKMTGVAAKLVDHTAEAVRLLKLTPAPRVDKTYHLTLLGLGSDEDAWAETTLLSDLEGRPPMGTYPIDTPFRQAVDSLLGPTEYSLCAKAPQLLPACFVGTDKVYYFAVIQSGNLCCHQKDDSAESYAYREPRDELRDQLWYSVYQRASQDNLAAYYDRDASVDSGFRYPKRSIRVEFGTRLGRRFRQAPIDRLFQSPVPVAPLTHAERVYQMFVDNAPEARQHLHSIIRPLYLPRSETESPSSSTVTLDCKTDDALEALWDTGASSSFITPATVAEHRFITRACKRLVRVANKAQCRATQEAFVTAVVVAPDGTPTVIRDWMVVFDVPYQVILGLPTLLGRMGNCFLDHIRLLVERHSGLPTSYPEVVFSDSANVLQTAQDGGEEKDAEAAPTEQPELEMGPEPMTDEFAARHDAQLLIRAWRNLTPVAPEDEDTPHPEDFPLHAHFLEMTVEEAQKEYEEKYSSRLGPAVLADAEVHKMMREKGSKVFVPQSWDGIKGITFHVNWSADLPAMRKPKARPINPRLFEHVEKEFKRLASYMYVPHDGPYASPLVVAPKASPPFIRLCGDYREMNRYIDGNHFPIPDVRRMLARLQGKKFFIDLDLSNAFHQIRLDEESSAKLSIQFPWAQMRPLFLPEGVKPGSHQLQRVATEVFAPIEQDALIAFDNLLIMADSVEHAKQLLDKVLDICVQRNIFLKLSKSNIIVQSVDFFGFTISPEGIQMQSQKKQEILDIPFPTNLPRARSFIGSTVYYSNFVPHYATLMAPLQAMVTQQFDWSDQSRLKELKLHFNAYKEALIAEMLLTFPDYSLPWTLRTDASTYGVGAVLFQTRTLPDGSLRHEPIHFLSQKFSDAATRWSTMEQECFGIYHALRSLDYYLWAKPLVIETDHANLQWMEQSVVPKVVRWRLFIQGFNVMIRHIPGRINRTADYLSRLHIPPGQEHLLFCGHGVLQRSDTRILSTGWASVPNFDAASSLAWVDMINSLNVASEAEVFFHAEEPQSDLLCPIRTRKHSRARMEEDDDEDGNDVPPAQTAPRDETRTPTAGPTHNARPEPQCEQPKKLSDDQMLQAVHNARRGHMGVARTWVKLKKEFPGHNVPYAFVESYVSSCAYCQKHRLGRQRLYYEPETRYFPTDHLHHSIGIDHLHMRKDQKGNRYALVVVNLFSKLVQIYPVKDKAAKTTAVCLLDYFSRFGLTELVRCDQGSDYSSAVVARLHDYLSIPQHFSLVRRHESSGVERSNREIRRHLMAILAEEELDGDWSNDTVLPVAQFVMNSAINGETGHTPFELHYGSAAAKYHSLPDATPSNADRYLKAFDIHLSEVRKASRLFQEKAQQERAADGPVVVTRFQPGDLILYDNRLLGVSRNKVTDALWAGPYEVISQDHNDITCRHVGLDEEAVLHANDVKLFVGSKSSAETVARFDRWQHLVKSILGHRGSHHGETREKLEFEVQFDDGSVVWKPYDDDLQANAQLQDYCRRHPYLLHVTEKGAAATKLVRDLKAKPLPAAIKPGAKVYVDLRAWKDYYDYLDLPDLFRTRHFVEGLVQKPNSPRAKPDLKIGLFSKAGEPHLLHSVPNLWFHQYSVTELPPGAVIVDAAFAQKYPQVLEG